MTEQEVINNQLKNKIEIHDEKFNSFMKSMDDFKEEMRQQNVMRANDISEIRNSVQSMQQSLMDMQTSNRNQNVLVIIGVAAMVIAVLLK